MPNFYDKIRSIKLNSSTDAAIEIGTSSSATPNFTIQADGKILWDNSTLYKSENGDLRTNSNLVVDGSISLPNAQTESSLSGSTFIPVIGLDRINKKSHNI